MPATALETNPVFKPVTTLCSSLCAVSDLLAEAVRTGISVRVEDGCVRARGPKHGREVGNAIVSRKAEVLAFLTAWNVAFADRLQVETDGLVERHGACGDDPEVASAAQAWLDAYQARDLVGVIDACRRIHVRALALAAVRGEAA